MNTTSKAISLILLLLLIITGFAAYSLKLLNSSADTLENHINLIEESVKVNEWDKATQNVKFMSDEWGKISKRWAMLIDHIELDNIDEALYKITSYIETGNASLSLAEINVLKGYIKHIPEKESLKLKNLF